MTPWVPPLRRHCDAEEQLLAQHVSPQPPPAQRVTTAEAAVPGAVGVGRPSWEASGGESGRREAEMVSLRQGQGLGGHPAESHIYGGAIGSIALDL